MLYRLCKYQSSQAGAYLSAAQTVQRLKRPSRLLPERYTDRTNTKATKQVPTLVYPNIQDQTLEAPQALPLSGLA